MGPRERREADPQRSRSACAPSGVRAPVIQVLGPERRRRWAIGYGTAERLVDLLCPRHDPEVPVVGDLGRIGRIACSHAARRELTGRTCLVGVLRVARTIWGCQRRAPAEPERCPPIAIIPFADTL